MRLHQQFLLLCLRIVLFLLTTMRGEKFLLEKRERKFSTSASDPEKSVLRLGREKRR
jgi:hypothetical protein